MWTVSLDNSVVSRNDKLQYGGMISAFSECVCFVSIEEGRQNIFFFTLSWQNSSREGCVRLWRFNGFCLFL